MKRLITLPRDEREKMLNERSSTRDKFWWSEGKATKRMEKLQEQLVKENETIFIYYHGDHLIGYDPNLPPKIRTVGANLYFSIEDK